ncbi:MarR family winged helix-turn-helix transcriptional regulator [Marinibaculum pumilum]|uniref:MarR family winged helix-turn-helix transcriptional regulator n=1 Tax=Marinibaculum pumilum TaxID=1766165 RepID=A0ABV7L8L9_9PROT
MPARSNQAGSGRGDIRRGGSPGERPGEHPGEHPGERRPAAGRSQPGTYLDYVLAQASERIRRDLSAAIARHGLPLEIWHILTLLQDGRGRAMGEVAEVALLSLPTATRTVDRMVAEALVYRAPDPEDRRRVLVLISDKGRALWRKVKRDADRHQKAVIARFGDDWVQELIAKLDELATGEGGDRA